MLKQFLYKYYMRYKRYRFRKAREKEGSYISKEAVGYYNVNFKGNNGVPERCRFSGNITIEEYTTLGINNFLHGDIAIGKYCQIGVDVAIHSTNHPTNYLSTYINYRLFKGELAKLKTKNKVVIGNDVWIGHNAIILGDTNIGNGAIIAAGAVVTKDVPPYSVVAGVPAKVIKQRFSDKIIKEIQELQWWNLSKQELEKIKPMFFKNLEKIQTIYEE